MAGEEQKPNYILYAAMGFLFALVIILIIVVGINVNASNKCKIRSNECYKDLNTVTSQFNILESDIIKANNLLFRVKKEEKETGKIRLTIDELAFIKSSKDYYALNPPKSNDSNYIYFLILSIIFGESQQAAMRKL